MVFYLYFPIQQGGNGPIFTTCSYSHINTKKVGKKREMLFLFPSGKVYYLPCVRNRGTFCPFAIGGTKRLRMCGEVES